MSWNFIRTSYGHHTSFFSQGQSQTSQHDVFDCEYMANYIFITMRHFMLVKLSCFIWSRAKSGSTQRGPSPGKICVSRFKYSRKFIRLIASHIEHIFNVLSFAFIASKQKRAQLCVTGNHTPCYIHRAQMEFLKPVHVHSFHLSLEIACWLVLPRYTP